MKYLLIFISFLCVSLSKASIGESLQESLKRYGNPRLVDRQLHQVCWDNGKISLVATFDATDHCDILQIFKNEVGSSLDPASFTENELSFC